MPTPISYNEALKAMRHDRKEKDREYRSHRKDRMKAGDRERLGALVIEFLSQKAETRENPTAGIEFALATPYGPLTIHYDIAWGTIFQKFYDPPPINAVPNANTYSGKWNFHFDPSISADMAFTSWKSELTYYVLNRGR